MKNNQLLDVLTREGVLIAVNIRYWRAWKKLNAQDVSTLMPWPSGRSASATNDSSHRRHSPHSH